MLLTARRAALAAAAPRWVAAPYVAARALAIVAGQDTPVSKEDLPEHIKAANTITQAPGSGKASGGGGQERAASGVGGTAASAASSGQETRGHPGPEADPYSGGDPSQQEQEGVGKE